MNKTNWGILGPGKIANKFASDLLKTEHANIVAVASRNLPKAQNFAKKYHAKSAYGSYQELVDDPTVDVIYVATPHNFHCEHTLLCLKAGKHVLCEKPMAVNEEQIKKMVNLAKSSNLFLMEAIWTAFQPSIEKVIYEIENNRIGEIVLIEADFGFKAPVNFQSRIYNPDLAGGSLLDIGIYPLFLCHLLLGKPDQINAIGSLSETKVDETCSIQLKWKNGAMANLHSTIMADTETSAKIYGTQGSIKMHRRWHETKNLSISNTMNNIEEWSSERNSFGYNYEATEVMECINKGKIQSDIISHQFSIDLVQSLDEIRRQIGVSYPFESI